MATAKEEELHDLSLEKGIYLHISGIGTQSNFLKYLT